MIAPTDIVQSQQRLQVPLNFRNKMRSLAPQPDGPNGLRQERPGPFRAGDHRLFYLA